MPRPTGAARHWAFNSRPTAVGRVLGPPAAGAMFDRIGIWSPYVAGSVLCVVAMVLVVTWGVDRRMTVVGLERLRECRIR